MNFLPKENIVYKTKLKEEEILKRLSDLIEPEKTFRFNVFSNNSLKSYEGQIKGNTFQIKRIINYRNSFLPRVTGLIEKDFDGLTIKVKMRLSIFVIIFLCFWCGAVGLGFLFALKQGAPESQFNPVKLIPLGMLTFVYLMTMLGFKFESNKAKKDLQAAFKANII